MAPAPAAAVQDASEAVAAVPPEPRPDSAGEPPNWPDDSAEAAFLAEARERGEPMPPKAAVAGVDDEAGRKPLPPLDELVNRIPAEVRETLDELFRTKFTRVVRVPPEALK